MTSLKRIHSATISVHLQFDKSDVRFTIRTAAFGNMMIYLSSLNSIPYYNLRYIRYRPPFRITILYTTHRPKCALTYPSYAFNCFVYIMSSMFI